MERMMDDQEQNEEQSTINGETTLAIPEEQAIDQQIIPFLDDELPAALATSGNIFISLPGICKALGLNTQAQFRRIQRTRTLSKGLRSIEIRTRGGFQRLNCLRVDLVALWLAGVQTSSIKAPFRAKIEAYQDELAPVAMQVFLRIAGLQSTQILPTADKSIIELAEQIDTLTETATFLREHMEAMLAAQGQVSMQLEQAVRLLEGLTSRQEATESQVARIDERTKRLTPAHAREVQLLVERIARAVEKPSPTATLQLAHAMVYGRLKTLYVIYNLERSGRLLNNWHYVYSELVSDVLLQRSRARLYINFRVAKYDQVSDERFEEVQTWLQEEWRRVRSGAPPEQESLF
jgi:hypothetical protein